jgi:hypothetical protein
MASKRLFIRGNIITSPSAETPHREPQSAAKNNILLYPNSSTKPPKIRVLPDQAVFSLFLVHFLNYFPREFQPIFEKKPESRYSRKNFEKSKVAGDPESRKVGKSKVVGIL